MQETHPKAAEIIALRLEGYRYNEIRDKLRISKGVVAGVLYRAKLTRKRKPAKPYVRKGRFRQKLKPVGKGGHPLTGKLIDAINEGPMPWREIAYKAGVPECRMSEWRNHIYPSLPEIEACFNVLGYDLDAVKRNADTCQHS